MRLKPSLPSPNLHHVIYSPSVILYVLFLYIVCFYGYSVKEVKEVKAFYGILHSINLNLCPLKTFTTFTFVKISNL